MAKFRIHLDSSVVIGCFSLVLFGIWFFLSSINASVFQNLAGTDPLAMVDVLFPYFWVLLISFLGVCFFAFVKAGNNRFLHVFLLVQLALMLYFTPFLLSGFSWSPDSLWHAGVADYMPEVFSGSNLVLTQYAKAYPFSFLITYFARHILGIGLIDYTLYVYPAICIVAMVSLAYFFAARFVNSKVAFLAMLFTLPSLHYFEPHVSPFSTGTILVFLSFVLLTIRSRLALGLSFLTMLFLVFTHPISPIVLGIYLFAAVIVSLLFRKKAVSYLAVSNALLLPLFLTLGIVWFSWIIFQAMPSYFGLRVTVLNVFNLSFLNRLFVASEFTVGGEAFIYSQIHDLGLAIYGLFLIFAIIPLFADLKTIFSARGREKSEASVYKRIIVVVAALLYVVMGFMLFMSSGERFLLGRGLLFFIFMASLAFATYLVSTIRIGNRVKYILSFGIILILLCTFPLVSYSKEAYNTFTPSSRAGLEFLSNSGLLVNKTISIGTYQQLASYANLSEGLNLTDYPPDLESQEPDIVVLRVNSYFIISMRYAMSFENNSFTQLRDNLESNQLYHKIYSNDNFEIYSKIS